MISKIAGFNQPNWIVKQKEQVNLQKKREEDRKRINPNDTSVEQEKPFNRNAKAPVEEFMLELLKAAQQQLKFDKKA